MAPWDPKEETVDASADAALVSGVTPGHFSDLIAVWAAVIKKFIRARRCNSFFGYTELGPK